MSSVLVAGEGRVELLVFVFFFTRFASTSSIYRVLFLVILMMAIMSRAVFFVVHILLLLGLQALFVEAAPTPQAADASASSFWVANIKRQGTAAFGSNSYQVFRNVKDFGAKGKIRSIHLQYAKLMPDK